MRKVGDGQRRVPGRVRSRLEGYGIFFVLIIVAQNRGGQAELPPLSLKTMEGIPTIEEYWEMLPRWRRGRINPLLIMLHGNQYTRRGSEYQLVDAPLSVFAEPSTITGTVLRDFQERSKQSGSIGDWDLFSRGCVPEYSCSKGSWTSDGRTSEANEPAEQQQQQQQRRGLTYFVVK